MNTKYLLLGAGFTKNFGGFLAQEMWAHIFNSPLVQASQSLRERLLADTDFESVYHDVLTNGDTPQRIAIVNATFNAYKLMDDNLRDFTFAPGAAYPVDIYRVQRMLSAFAGTRGTPGYIFSLNQDLFLERHYYNGPRPVMPGVNQSTTWFSTHFDNALEVASFAQLADEKELEKVKAGYRIQFELVYLKLHGSCNWHNLTDPSAMIIGRDKVSQIKRNALLSWYFDLFESCLRVPRARVLVIGYGFADPHINAALAAASSKCDLSIYVLDPTPTAIIIQRIRAVPQGERILSAIRAFYPVTLADLFPANQQETAQWGNMEEGFFERRIA